MISHPDLDQTICLWSVDSTNLEVRRRRTDFLNKNVLLISDEQTAGKGQHGRHWDSQADLGLWMSLLLGRPQNLSTDLNLLSIYTGIVLQQALQKIVDPMVQLKWPNDLLINGEKCGGILTEIQWQGATPSSAIIGVGLNLMHQIDDFPSELQDSATSLFLQGCKSLNRDEIATQFTHDFFVNFSKLNQGAKLAAIWNRHAYRINEPVEWVSEDKSFKGQFLGINENGEACVSLHGKPKCFKNGEMRLKMVP